MNEKGYANHQFQILYLISEVGYRKSSKRSEFRELSTQKRFTGKIRWIKKVTRKVNFKMKFQKCDKNVVDERQINVKK